MKKVLLWGTGFCFKDNIKFIKCYEKLGKIKVIGVTSDASNYANILEYPFIAKREIARNFFDVLIIMAKGENVPEIIKEAVQMGIKEEVIIPINTMILPGFSFEKYYKIKENVPTIFSPNCWGGLTYKNLGLEYKSPFTNLYLLHEDYIKFLKSPKVYLDTPLELKRMEYNSITKEEFPIAQCYDILLYFNHYSTFEEAQKCWERRKERIDWDNILVMFYDENQDLIDEFSNLTWENKICFVPVSSNNPEHVSLNYKKEACNKAFSQVVNEAAWGVGFHYDVFELLLNKKIVPITEWD